MKFRAMYYTPSGYRFWNFDADDADDAYDKAHERCSFGVVELQYVTCLDDITQESEPQSRLQQRPKKRLLTKLKRLLKARSNNNGDEQA